MPKFWNTKLRFALLSAVYAGLALLLAACAVQTPTPPPAPAQEADASAPGGVLRGQVMDTAGRWEEEPLRIFAAPFSGDDQGAGFYMLEPAIHPSAELGEQGDFVLSAVPAGRYVLVVGPTAEQALTVVDEGGETRVFTVKTGETVDLGRVQLAP
ncbi:hypothetical protein [Levilinea saccharolytica]|uniref:Carboxypeptidase regulatory-like domain-containing protein n=1 Tax=Levilinea saccharolytica TaxID=229921 RepID=A0A0P6XWD4_9CHLR|nr:hypothetical protein [Levilinea saccharolytica]KPL79763.1 hypothetical protein ADN01_13860 [Levilinea saccharolytica]GAP16781.1 hypothetical protein LSAC_00638 [Levilinea saccharolytica]